MMKNQKMWTSILLLVLTYVVPLYIFRQYQNDYINIDLIQKVVFAILLIGSVILVYINDKNRRQIENLKWLWLLFEILGILGTVYSIGVLLLIFVFRHGIGF